MDIVPAALYVLDDFGEGGLKVGEYLRRLLGDDADLDGAARARDSVSETLPREEENRGSE